MKRIMLVSLVLMLILLESCTVVCPIIGSQIKKRKSFKEPISSEEVETIKINSPVKVESNNFIINSKFLSHKNDTLIVEIGSKDFDRLINTINNPELVLAKTKL